PARPSPPGRPNGVAQPKAGAPAARGGGAPQSAPSTRPNARPATPHDPKVLRPGAARLPFKPPAVAQPTTSRPKATPNPARAAGPARPAPVPRGAVVQRFRPPVVQATKFFPNLHPGAVERVEPGQVFRLESFTDQYRLRKSDGHGVYVPNQQYNFVRTVEGQMLLHNRYRHPSIAEGRHVLYAGEVFFNNGRLEWWSNGSGHYQPDSEDARQAALPMDNFYTYQQVIKGEHKRRKG
ncbi:MAG TPA: hypothetical protein VN282_10335, partial [Pyrinomonadaceae bacterium]|nr:hypothetical protein [Pyrinomonadaceae bacterium]